ncbi:methyl-accepting chemotaxis sensory transducer with Cache sensor [Caloramator quimbayensis]|uniref:Methyl-accepting chemotaxis sensory transducer with Cache sensor n=1 Tax=Caloramator quimbayensis TaxID=1147123 RepID=A0A1T4Y2X6_9CLOT|nr:methyl-accepting chemotaxis protein [Caloramator quimbayensis]SKA95681.1 methyl-accepting chemotaxis sensory transducer with Cache sensor [Caloramator quimbayensis]
MKKKLKLSNPFSSANCRSIKKIKIHFLSKDKLSTKLIKVIASTTALSFILLISLVTSIVVSSTKKQYINSANQILNQNKNHIEYIINSISNYSLQITSDKDLISTISLYSSYNNDYDRLTAYNTVQNKIRSIALSNNIISSIHIIGIDGFKCGYPDIQSDITIDKIPYYNEISKIKTSDFWTPPLNLKLGYNDNFCIANYTIIKNLLNAKDIGILIIGIKPHELSKALVSQNSLSTIYIVDDKGNIVAHPNQDLVGKNIKEKGLKLDSFEGSFNYKNNNKDMFVVYTTSNVNGWKFVYEMPNSLLTQNANTIRNYIILIGILSILFIIAIITIYMNKLLKPLETISIAAKSIESGNLNTSINIKSNDEIGLLSKTFNNMVQNLKAMIERIISVIDETKNVNQKVSSDIIELYAQIQEISASMQSISQGALNQNEKTYSCSEMVKSFGDSLKDVINLFSNIDKKSRYAMDKSQNGISYINGVGEKFVENTKLIDDMKNISFELTNSTKNIESILDDINKISEQTNLLALNAAIEAARAGDAGKGFMVVAEEVRKLADSSKKSATSIAKIINDIDTKIAKTSETIINISKVLSSQTSSISEITSIFNEINLSFNEALNSIQCFAETFKNIDNQKNDIINSISEIADISQNTSSAIQEISASSEEQVKVVENVKQLMSELDEVSDKLQSMASQFQI